MYKSGEQCRLGQNTTRYRKQKKNNKILFFVGMSDLYRSPMPPSRSSPRDNSTRGRHLNVCTSLTHNTRPLSGYKIVRRSDDNGLTCKKCMRLYYILQQRCMSKRLMYIMCSCVVATRMRCEGERKYKYYVLLSGRHFTTPTFVISV